MKYPIPSKLSSFSYCFFILMFVVVYTKGEESRGRKSNHGNVHQHIFKDKSIGMDSGQVKTRNILDESSLAINQLMYPTNNEIAYFPALSQPYSVLYFPLDNTNDDLCQLNSSSSSLVRNLISDNNIGNTTCIQYFCTCSIDSRVCNNLTISLLLDETFRNDYFAMVNYCIHCNQENSDRFRMEISKSNGQCSGKFPSYSQIQQSLIGHCNDELSESEINSIVSNNQSSSGDDINIGILDWRYYIPNQYYSKMYFNNKTSSDKDNSLHLFETLFRNRMTNPILCWCKNELYGGFAYKCADAYYNFLVRFKYIGTPWWFMFFFTLYTTKMTIYNTIPLIHAKNSSIRKKIEQRKSRESTSPLKMYLKVLLEELFLTDLRFPILVFIYMQSFFFFIENMVSYMWNYAFMPSGLKNIYIWGCFRALAVYAFGYGISTLMVQWSHIVDLIKSNQSKKNLSKYNLVLLVSIYIFNSILIVIAIVLCSILKTSVYLFALAAVVMIFVPSILIISFTIYGVVIYRRLKNYQNVNISQMRFFKFILIFNTVLFFAFVLALVFVPTFISTWDIYGIFVALFKNFAIDSAALVGTYVVTYILINENEFLKCYGVKASFFMICYKAPESMVSPMSLPSLNSARERALSATSNPNNNPPPSFVKPATSLENEDEELERSTTVSSIQTSITTASSSPMLVTPTTSNICNDENGESKNVV